MGKRNRGGVEHQEADSHLADVVSAFKSAMDRRNFVRSAGGILVASGIGCFVDRTGVSAGFIEVTVTGLTPGAPNAGVVTVTPAGGGTSTPFTIPAGGVGKTEVIAGTYNVSYTAPQDHVLAPGSVVPATVTVVAGETTTFTLALTVALQIGTLQVTVTGLAAGATSGGTAVVTPSAGGAPVTLDIGPTGIAAAQFAAGSYSVSYTPPAGYTLTSGTTPQTVTVTLNQTTTLPFGVTIIPAAVGTLQINVTGIGAGAANGGTAVATPNAGGSPTTLIVAVSGTVSGTLAVGSYSVTYTAPTGHVITSGTTPQAVTITANTTTTIAFVLTAFPPPDILADASFETDFDGFKDFSGGEPSNGVTRAQDFARTGLFSARFSWTPSGADIGSEMAFSFAGQDRIWVRFYFRLTSNVSTIWKFCRNRQTGFGTLFGGLFIEDNNKIVSWGFDAELSAQTVAIGLTKAQVLDGNWHSIEYDYWRNGDPSGFPSVAFWFDGNPVSGASAPSPGSWQNGRLVAGSRGSSIRIGLIQMMSTLNGGNSTSGQCNIDDVAISSLGRIGA